MTFDEVKIRVPGSSAMFADTGWEPAERHGTMD